MLYSRTGLLDSNISCSVINNSDTCKTGSSRGYRFSSVVITQRNRSHVRGNMGIACRTSSKSCMEYCPLQIRNFNSCPGGQSPY